MNNLFKAYGNYTTNTPTAVSRNNRASEKKETAEISSKAKDFSNILQAMSDSEDSRSNKVQEIKTQVDMGRYNVSSSAIANKLLRDYYKSEM